MIITITCNPAIDKTVYADKTVFDIGGKGINVSKVLKELGVESIATGFIGKENKNVILDALDNFGIKHHFIEVDGEVRTNTKIIIDNQLYEENQTGPIINDESVNALKEYLNQFNNEIIILSGSCTRNIYYDLICLLKKNNNYVILDCDGELLVDGIKAKPDVVKPNKDEVCRYLKCSYDESLIIDKTKSLGLDLVCISLGDEGSIFVTKNGVFKANALDIDYRSSTGAGDSMVGAMAYSRINNLDIIETIKLAVACASASCETIGSKVPCKDNIFAKKERVEVVKL